MRRKERKITEKDLYIIHDSAIHYITLCLGTALFKVPEIIWDGSQSIAVSRLFVIVGCIVFLESFAKRIEIHDDEITYRNYFWIKRKYKLNEISLVDLKNENKRFPKVVVYGEKGKQLFSMSDTRQEILLAIHYFKSKGIELGSTIKMSDLLRLEDSYEQIYKECYEMAEKLALGRDDREGASLTTNFSSIRLKRIEKANKAVKAANKKRIREVLPYWNIKGRKIKPYYHMDFWRIGNKFELVISEDIEGSIKRSKLIEHCEKEELLFNPHLSMLDGSRYLIKDKTYYEAFKINKLDEYLGLFKHKSRNYKNEFYQAGQLLGKLHQIVDFNPEVVKNADHTKRVTTMNQLTSHVKEKFRQAEYMEITEEQLSHLIDELSYYYEVLPKGNVLQLDGTSFSVYKRQVKFSESLYDVEKSYGIPIEDICLYIAELTTGISPYGKKTAPKNMKQYFEAMCEGYDSIRPLTKEEKKCLNLLLQAQIAIKIARELPFVSDSKRLVKLYELMD